MRSEKPKMLDLFAGIGGFSLGFHRAGFETAAFSEVEKFPCEVLEHRFPGVPNLGDVSKITASQLKALGRIDVVSFGSPCQDWSVAGKRLGLEGERSSLFHEAIRIIRYTRPRYAVFENVPGLFSSARGWDFAAVLDEMADAGALDVAWSVLDAQWFGVPQRRRRIFLVADFGGERAGEILSIAEGVCRDSAPSRETGQEAARGAGDSAPLTLRNGARDTDTRPGRTGIGLAKDQSFALQAEQQHAVVFGGGRASGPTEVETSVGTKNRQDFDTEDLVVDALPFDTTQITSDKNYSNPRVGDMDHPLATGAHPPAVAVRTANTNANGHGVAYEPAHALDVAQGQAVAFHVTQDPVSGEKTPCLSQGNREGCATLGVAQDMAVRRLTPLECERLQGFPDSWTDIPGASDSARYKALGNAVAVPVVEWIARRIKPHVG